MDFPSNSKDPRPKVAAAAPETKSVKRVVEGEVVRRKKPWYKKFRDSIVGDSEQSVWEYVLFEVVIPNGRDMLMDAGETAMRRKLYGDDDRARRGSSRSSRDSYDYNNRYKSSGRGTAYRDEPRQISSRSRATHDFDEVEFPTRAEADVVLDRLIIFVEKFGQATVADFYELAGISANFTDGKWGWMDLRGVSVKRAGRGWIITLPRTEPVE